MVNQSLPMSFGLDCWEKEKFENITSWDNMNVGEIAVSKI